MQEETIEEIKKGLMIEEYKQLHEHIRVHEKEMGNLTIAMVTVSVALLSAVGIFYFRISSQSSGGLNIALSYLFLSPVLIVIPLLSAIRGHRDSLYKMGLYIKVFYEIEFGGIGWHVRLEKYQARQKGESQDSAPYFAWVVFFISYFFYLYSLTQAQIISCFHYFSPLIFIPALVLQHYKHNDIKNIILIESAWRYVKEK